MNQTASKYSRRPAVLALILCATAGALYFAADTSGARTVAGPELEELERAIASPDAGSDVWLLYGQRLLADKRHAHAAMAFERVLQKDPYCRVANLQRAAALALTGDADGFYAFASKLVLADPRLTQDILGQPESQSYLAADRFQTLLAQARIQSMD